jgi:CheY-like chemotaxis protein
MCWRPGRLWVSRMTREAQISQLRTRPGGPRRSPAPPVSLATVGRAAGPGTRDAPPIRPLRVLVVDDCHDTADCTAQLVGLWRHDVRRAYTGATAVQVAAEYLPDVLLVDLGMRGMDGCEVARRVRRLPGLGRVFLIAVAGYTGAGHRRLAAAAGFDFYVPKPVDPMTLETLLMSREIELWADPAPATPPPADYRILVVDDDDGVRRFLAAGLPREGFAVWLAANGQEAADLLRACRPGIDVVLMDVRMPGRDGPETLAALREQDPQVRCCFMSGDLGEHSEVGLRQLGTGEVLHKPFTTAEAGRALRAEIERREADEDARDSQWRDDGGQGQRPGQ